MILFKTALELYWERSWFEKILLFLEVLLDKEKVPLSFTLEILIQFLLFWSAKLVS